MWLMEGISLVCTLSSGLGPFQVNRNEQSISDFKALISVQLEISNRRSTNLNFMLRPEMVVLIRFTSSRCSSLRWRPISSEAVGNHAMILRISTEIGHALSLTNMPLPQAQVGSTLRLDALSNKDSLNEKSLALENRT